MTAIILTAAWIAATLVGIGLLAATQPFWDQRRAEAVRCREEAHRRSR